MCDAPSWSDKGALCFVLLLRLVPFPTVVSSMCCRLPRHVSTIIPKTPLLSPPLLTFPCAYARVSVSARSTQGGTIEVADQTLSADDLMLKRGFKGDKDVFEAAVSEDGKVMVVLDTRKDEKVLSQKLAREIVSRIQKLRKKSGLQVGETVEVRWRDSETRRPKGQKIAPNFFVLLRQGFGGCWNVGKRRIWD